MKIDGRVLGAVAEAILTTIEDAGSFVIAASLPNAGRVLARMMYKNQYSANTYCRNKLSELVDRGLVQRIQKPDGRIVLRLTKNGEIALRYKSTKVRMKKTRRRWDGKWRIVMFDIWESSRAKRDHFRRELKRFGFVQLQQSVWIYPYDCEEYVMLLRTDMKFGKNIRYIVAEYIDAETTLLKTFGVRR